MPVVGDTDPTLDGPAAPRRIGTYRIEGPLGRGGMGEVLRAYDDALRRPVAIKRLSAALRDDPVARARFWREARALAALRHPGVVRIHRIDETPDGDLYLVMELIEGRPLSDLLAQPWPPGIAVALARAAADALGAAHAEGLTHRDVKPGNLLIERDGTPRVVDFGLARRGDDRVTRTDARPGTPAYMAPEQIDGAAVGPPADVFALGVVLYRLLTGVHPFVRETPSATAMAAATARHAPIDAVRPDLPPSLVAVVERCLAHAPDARYPDGRALAAALEATGLAVGPAALAALVAGAPPPTEAGVVLAPAPNDLSLPAWAVASAPLPAAAPRRRKWPWIAGLCVALAAGAALLAWPRRAFDTTPLRLPPRPAVAVLDFEGRDGDVFADALRFALDGAPERLVSVPRAMLAASAGGLDPRFLVRPDRAPGHVDVVLRGTLEPRGDSLDATFDAIDTTSGDVLRSFSVEGADEPVAFAFTVAPLVARVMGADLPPASPPTRAPGAWGALLGARRAFAAGDTEGHERQLSWALQLDPDFALARLDELAALRAQRRYAELAERGRALLRKPLAPRLRAHAEAWVALAEGRGGDALRGLHALIERWPYDVEAYETLLILRFYDPELRDLAEVERLAKRTLQLAPRHEDAASRLVRSLAFRGRADDALYVMVDLGVPRSDVAFAEVWGELSLYRGDYPEAIEQFGLALARSPDDLYAEHMAIAARLLSGRCEDAAVAALHRIQRIEALGHDANLDWTYSLATQALLCGAQWGPLAQALDRWTAHSVSGRDQARVLRHRVALAKGEPRAQVAAAVLADLDDAALPAPSRPQLLRLLARAADDPAVLRARAAAAGEAAVAMTTAPADRRPWQHAAAALRARLAELEAGDLEPLRALAGPWSAVRSEGDLGLRVESLALYAEALDRAERAADARAVWTEIRDLGYPRLWSTDVWLAAVRRLGP